MNKLVLPVSVRSLMNELMELDERKRFLVSLCTDTELIAHSEEDLLFSVLIDAIIETKRSIEEFESMALRRGLL